MWDWLARAALGSIAGLLLLVVVTRIVARTWYDEQRIHLKRLIAAPDEEENLKENKHDGMER